MRCTRCGSDGGMLILGGYCEPCWHAMPGDEIPTVEQIDDALAQLIDWPAFAAATGMRAEDRERIRRAKQGATR